MTSTINNGTISVSAGSTAVTGSGTTFSTLEVSAGDQFVAAGLTGVVAAVNSNTSLTLVRPWPGSTLSGAAYDILLRNSGDVLAVGLVQLASAMQGKLGALDALAGGANQLPYFNGASTMTQTALTAFARTLLDDANSAAARGTLGLGSSAVADVLGTVAQSGGVPTGALIQRGSNSNGEFVRFADGTQICTWHQNFENVAVTTQAGSIYINGTELTWTFPASFVTTNNLVCHASPRTSAVIWARARTTGTGGAGLRVFSATSVTASLFLEMSAIGRWF